MEVVGEAQDGEEAVREAARTCPDVVLLDLAMGRHPGLPAVSRIFQASPRSKVLVLTMLADPASLRASLAAGASGFVLKHAADTELLEAIRTVAQGRVFVRLSSETTAFQDSLGTRKDRQPGSEDNRFTQLSPRERNVFGLVAQGFTNQQIAEQLGLSVKSVETYRSRVMEKLGLRNRADLVKYALECGVLKFEDPTR